MKSSIYRLVLRILFFNSVIRAFDDNLETLYIKGITHYHAGNWSDCNHNMKRVVELFRLFKSSSIECFRNTHISRNCSSSYNHNYNVNLDIRILNLNFTLCITEHLLQNRIRDFNVSSQTLTELNDFESYDYLQYCAYKNGNVKEAADAAYTLGVNVPGVERTVQNINYYLNHFSLNYDDLINLEEYPFQKHYTYGIEAYSNSKWMNVVTHMTKAAQSFIQEELNCRVFCEVMNQNSPIRKITDYYIGVIRCQDGCENKLSVLGGSRIPYLYATFFHYRQFSYYKLNEYESALRDISTYLLFDPHNQVMVNNKLYYADLGYDLSDFPPHQDAIDYHEMRLKLTDATNLARRITNEESRENVEKFQVNPVESYEKTGIYLESSIKALREHKTFVASGFLMDIHCQVAIDLYQTLAEKFKTDRIFSYSDMLKEIKDENLHFVRILANAALTIKSYAENAFGLDALHIISLDLMCPHGSSVTPELENKTTINNTMTIFRSFLHLNDVLRGGEIFLPNEIIVKSSCGLLLTTPYSAQLSISPHPDARRCMVVYTLSHNKSHIPSDLQSLLTSFESQFQYPLPMIPGDRKSTIGALETTGAKLTVEEHDLREKRFIADNIMDEELCRSMVSFIEKTAIPGDGYPSRSTHVSPHTIHEKFAGLNIQRLHDLVRRGQLQNSDLNSVMLVSAASRDIIRRYFNISSQLYFDFSHLLCREALNESNQERADLSHPVHSDNCKLQDDGSCLKEPPAYIHRHFSAILYLNDDFHGGNFFFADKNLDIEYEVTPKCGRLVAFWADLLHGVKAVLSGHRCAIAMWFTLDANHAETARVLAWKYLRSQGFHTDYDFTQLKFPFRYKSQPMKEEL